MANLKENILKIKYRERCIDENIADVTFNGITYHNVVVDDAIKELSSEATELKLLLTDKERDGSFHLRIVEDYI